MNESSVTHLMSNLMLIAMVSWQRNFRGAGYA
jgi:hypothetical protein